MRIRQMFGGELAGGVDPAALADRADRREVVFLALVNEGAVDLAGRELDEALDAHFDRGFDHLVRAEQVHFHRPHRAAVHCVDTGDGSAMDDEAAAVDRLADRVVVQHVALDEGEVLVAFEVRKLQRVAMQIVEDHHLIVVDELGDKVRADEAGAAGDEDLLVGQGHESERLRSACRCGIAHAWEPERAPEPCAGGRACRGGCPT